MEKWIRNSILFWLFFPHLPCYATHVGIGIVRIPLKKAETARIKGNLGGAFQFIFENKWGDLVLEPSADQFFRVIATVGESEIDSASELLLDIGPSRVIKVVTSVPDGIHSETSHVTLVVSVPSRQLLNFSIRAKGRVSIQGKFQQEFSNEKERKRFGSVNSQNGPILVTNFVVAEGLLIKSFSGNVAVQDCSGDITVSNSDGMIQIAGHKKGCVNAQSISGSIVLNNPEALAEDAQSRDGTVQGQTQPSRAELESEYFRISSPNQAVQEVVAGLGQSEERN